MSRLFLFDELARTNAQEARGEDSFTFLNRAASPYWERVRRFLDTAFTAYPAEHAADLRGRFRDRRWSEHIGAWWELYLFTFFRARGARVEVHPALPGLGTRPDFRVQLGSSIVFVEARYVAAGLAATEQSVGRDDWITGPLDTLKHPDFMVSVRILARGHSQPRRAQVTAGVMPWLDALDVAEVAGRPVQEFPDFYGRAGDWEFELTALPMARDNRSDRARRLVGIYPAIGGRDNTVTALRAALKEKAGKYGRLKNPFVLAPLLTTGYLDTEDVCSALFGTDVVSLLPTAPGHAVRRGHSDGFWRPGSDSRHTRVSGVLLGDAITPWRAAAALPRLWLNPRAAHPLAENLGLPTAAIGPDRRLIQSVDDPKGAEVFGLDPDWPGPDPPFPS